MKQKMLSVDAGLTTRKIFFCPCTLHLPAMAKPHINKEMNVQTITGKIPSNLVYSRSVRGVHLHEWQLLGQHNLKQLWQQVQQQQQQKFKNKKRTAGAASMPTAWPYAASFSPDGVLPPKSLSKISLPPRSPPTEFGSRPPVASSAMAVLAPATMPVCFCCPVKKKEWK